MSMLYNRGINGLEQLLIIQDIDKIDGCLDYIGLNDDCKIRANFLSDFLLEERLLDYTEVKSRFISNAEKIKNVLNVGTPKTEKVELPKRDEFYPVVSTNDLFSYFRDDGEYSKKKYLELTKKVEEAKQSFETKKDDGDLNNPLLYLMLNDNEDYVDLILTEIGLEDDCETRNKFLMDVAGVTGGTRGYTMVDGEMKCLEDDVKCDYAVMCEMFVNGHWR